MCKDGSNFIRMDVYFRCYLIKHFYREQTVGFDIKNKYSLNSKMDEVKIWDTHCYRGYLMCCTLKKSRP